MLPCGVAGEVCSGLLRFATQRVREWNLAFRSQSSILAVGPRMCARLLRLPATSPARGKIERFKKSGSIHMDVQRTRLTVHFREFI